MCTPTTALTPEDGSLICDLFEHTHDDSCYSIEYELVCGLEEGASLWRNPTRTMCRWDEEAFAVFDDAVALQPVVDDSSPGHPSASPHRTPAMRKCWSAACRSTTTP